MILNLTQHKATPDQVSAGVTDLPPARMAALKALLTVDDLPSKQDILDRTHDIALLAVHNGLGGDDADDPMPWAAMIGGAPWMMRALENALINAGIKPVYAFSKRESIDIPQPDGSVRKDNLFRHAGWVEVF